MGNQLATNPQTTAIENIRAYIQSPQIMPRFQEILGKHAGAYIASVMIQVSGNKDLMECSGESIAKSALRAASLKLSCDPATGYAYLVPFKVRGVPTCNLIVGYKGYQQLALRTHRYEDINLAKIYDGQTVIEDQLSGRHQIAGLPVSRKVIGYIFYFKLKDGFSKTFYMSVEDCMEHGQRYSKTFNYDSSLWKTNPAVMCEKTVVRMALSKWGVLDPNDADELEAIDAENEGADIIDSEYTPSSRENAKEQAEEERATDPEAYLMGLKAMGLDDKDIELMRQKIAAANAPKQSAPAPRPMNMDAVKPLTAPVALSGKPATITAERVEQAQAELAGEPAPAPSAWNPAILAALARELGIVTNRVKNSLDMSNLPFTATLEDCRAWMASYKYFRDAGFTPQESAENANG